MPQIKQNLTDVNFTPRGTAPSWIVIHNTANGTSAEGTAYNNTQYFKSAMRNASATYFIDDGDTVWQCVRDTDTAWHCGESASRNGCTNYNSIGIEVCERADGTFSDHEIAVLAWLVGSLMDEYGIDADHICRHHDVTGKLCPWYYSDDAQWARLKARILEQEEQMTIPVKITQRGDGLYRLWNRTTKDHFYTTSKAERDSAQKSGYTYEGEMSLPAPEVPVYRLWNKASADHFYTASYDEAASAEKGGYKCECVEFCAAREGADVYRLWSKKNGDHFYTTSKAERDSAQKSGYTYEGVAFRL